MAGEVGIREGGVETGDAGRLIGGQRGQGCQRGLAAGEGGGGAGLQGQGAGAFGVNAAQAFLGVGEAGAGGALFGAQGSQRFLKARQRRHRRAARRFGGGQPGEHLGQRGLAGFGPGAHVGERGLDGLALGGGQPSGLDPGVDLVAGLRQRQIERLGLGHQRVAPGLGAGQTAAQIAALGQQGGHLRLETGDLGARGLEIGAAGGQIAAQRGDRRLLLAGGAAQRVKIAVEPRHLPLQRADPAARQAQSVGQAGDLRGQPFEFVVLGGDRVAQDALHDHEDRQHEHQHQQQRGHRIDKARPDRGREALTAAPREAHQ